MLVLGLLSLAVLGCTSTDIPETKENKITYASNQLAFELLRSYKDDKNVFISPFSISTVLGMVYLGSDGTTERDMRKLLHYDKYGLGYEDVHSGFRSLMTKVTRNTEDYQLSSYNSVLVQNFFTILHIYGHAVTQYYSANIESVDFASQGVEVQNKINEAVEKETKGKIKNFLEKPLSADTKLFLLNVVYFVGNWKTPFNPRSTHEGTFYNNGVQEKKVQMMHRDSQFQHTFQTDLNASVVVLPYKGEQSASMVLVVPRDRTGVAELAEKMTQESLDKAVASTVRGRLELSLPKFSMEYSTDLAESLVKLGLGELFHNPDLSRMVGDLAQLSVSSIKHKAVIDVNENGSEAAAATGVDIVLVSMPPSLRVDRPFLFFIRDDTSGMILFSGRVNEL